ncbi:MAG TPA: L-aspartate oxidase [Thermoplasmata archaeon]|nr:L-aspartate oxidase [Thermoplasmata archaeon]
MPVALRPLIIGSGIAGLYVALRCQELGLQPTVVTKATLEESNTRYAQGGIAAAVGPDDSAEYHFRDTLRAGAGLVDPEAARILVTEAPRRIADLVRFGVPFDTVEGQVALGREAAHSRARILHAGGDTTGLRVEETLQRRALERGIEARERTSLRRIEASEDGTVRATLARDSEAEGEVVDAHPLVLATGGAGSLFRESSNPTVATGEGVAIAGRAGALLLDLEFMQFHPTVFYREGAPRHLLTEALRGEGALLRNGLGERFMPRYHPEAEMAPRDVVSRAIQQELDRTGSRSVFLDATGIPRDRLFARFPSISRFLAEYALDPSRDLIPVTPAAHFMVGGVGTDHEGRTSLPGLLACGEVAATGVHGANRLASNSLLEGMVFGERVVRQVLHPAPGGPPTPRRVIDFDLEAGRGRSPPRDALATVREILWTEVGIVRTGPGLRRARRQLSRLFGAVEPADPARLPSPIANTVLTALLITESALAREESRGTHYREDFPAPRTEWRTHLGLRVRSRRSDRRGASDGGTPSRARRRISRRPNS